MRKEDILKKIHTLETELKTYPKGSLTYKNIKGKEQPYLQWTQDGKSKCRYIKLDEREHILCMIEERTQAQAELKRLRAYYERVGDILERNPYMANSDIAIGEQSYEDLITKDSFYIDKTYFIRDWWQDHTKVTLITRPRRFGKTLTLSMAECFFSTRYQGRRDLFEGLSIWKQEEFRKLQGTLPVIFMTFAGVKSKDYTGALHQVSVYLSSLYATHRYVLESDNLPQREKESFCRIEQRLMEADAAVCRTALYHLCRFLADYHQKQVVVLIDEYDTPILEGYLSGYFGEILDLMRNIYNTTLKTNQYLQKALLTGITQVAKESIFSDMNHLHAVSTTSPEYADVFGFTEQEVFCALDCLDIEEKAKVKHWYDGFTFGGKTDIYNPWSITMYLKERTFQPYWAHSGGHQMISELFLKGKDALKEDLETLLAGGSVHKSFQEVINLEELEYESEAIWPFLLAAGYLRADHVVKGEDTTADLSITNRDTASIFRRMVGRWFLRAQTEYNEFCRCLLKDDVELMNEYMNEMTVDMISFFDVGSRPSRRPPERFYHGLVLGLIVELRDQYEVTSNRESGLGRYDIMLRPKKEGLNGIIIEFKVRNEKKEASLEDTLQAAFAQIEQKQYEAELLRAGIPGDCICKYGFAFEGKQVLIGKME